MLEFNNLCARQGKHWLCLAPVRAPHYSTEIHACECNRIVLDGAQELSSLADQGVQGAWELNVGQEVSINV